MKWLKEPFGQVVVIMVVAYVLIVFGIAYIPPLFGVASATTLIETMVRTLPVYGQLRLARRLVDTIPFLGPILPDPGLESRRTSRRREPRCAQPGGAERHGFLKREWGLVEVQPESRPC